MVHVPALPKIAVVLGDMLICLRRCGIGVILSIGSCVRGWESIMIQSCFRYASCTSLLAQEPSVILTSSSSQQKQSLVSFTILWDDQKKGRSARFIHMFVHIF